jgi:hypothetical protein
MRQLQISTAAAGAKCLPAAGRPGEANRDRPCSMARLLAAAVFALGALRRNRTADALIGAG